MRPRTAVKTANHLDRVRLVFIAREGFPRAVAGVVEPDAEASGPTGRGAGPSDKHLETFLNISGTHILNFMLAGDACPGR